jgi:hypothetical protein
VYSEPVCAERAVQEKLRQFRPGMIADRKLHFRSGVMSNGRWLWEGYSQKKL